MIFESVTHVWTCKECKDESKSKIWKWEIVVNPNDVFDRQKLQYMEFVITNHVLRTEHEVLHRSDENPIFKEGSSKLGKL